MSCGSYRKPLVKQELVHVDLVLDEEERATCSTDVYPEGEDFSTALGLGFLYNDFARCKDKHTALVKRIEDYNTVQQKAVAKDKQK